MRRIFSTKEDSPGVIAALLAILLLHVVLLLPTYPENIVPRAFLFLPIELPVLILLFAVPLGRLALLRRWLLALALTVFTVIKLANIATFLGFNRPFNPIVDPALIVIAVETLGKTSTELMVGAVAGALLLILLVAALFSASRA